MTNVAQLLESLLYNLVVVLLLSDQHFSVDRALLKAWAFLSSRQRKDGKEDPPTCANNAF
jgi:hypothetical protein